MDIKRLELPNNRRGNQLASLLDFDVQKRKGLILAKCWTVLGRLQKRQSLFLSLNRDLGPCRVIL